MKTQIRFGTFETNSSSTHAICIAKSQIHPIDGLKFEYGEFGWEEEEYIDAQTKLSYWYTALVNYHDKYILEYIQKAKQLLESVGCKDITIDGIKVDKNGYYDTGYIDHGYDLGNWPISCVDDGSFVNFILDTNSILILGNDNSDRDIYKLVNESDYNEVIYKGN